MLLWFGDERRYYTTKVYVNGKSKGCGLLMKEDIEKP